MALKTASFSTWGTAAAKWLWLRDASHTSSSTGSPSSAVVVKNCTYPNASTYRPAHPPSHLGRSRIIALNHAYHLAE